MSYHYFLTRKGAMSLVNELRASHRPAFLVERRWWIFAYYRVAVIPDNPYKRL